MVSGRVDEYSPLWAVRETAVVPLMAIIDGSFAQVTGQYLYMPFCCGSLMYIGMTRRTVKKRIINHVHDNSTLGLCLPLRLYNREVRIVDNRFSAVLDIVPAVLDLRIGSWIVKIHTIDGDIGEAERQYIRVYQPILNIKGSENPGVYWDEEA